MTPHLLQLPANKLYLSLHQNEHFAFLHFALQVLSDTVLERVFCRILEHLKDSNYCLVDEKVDG